MRQNDTLRMVPGLLEIARKAGKVILAIYERQAVHSDPTDILVKHKDDNSPLTLADLAANAEITQALHRLTPHLPIVSEEDEASHACRNSSGTFWLIDPLDGTKEFLARNGEFTVNIALIDNGCPVLGVVFAPALDQLYWGGAGVGAFRQTAAGQTAIRVAAPPEKDNMVRVVASKSHLNQETVELINRLGHHRLVQAGSSLKFCRVAEGDADFYPRLGPTCEWDTAAAQAIVEGAGGCVLTLEGNPLRYGKSDILNPCFIAASAPFDRMELQC